MARHTVRVTIDLTMDTESCEDWHPSYFGRVVEFGVQKVAETHSEIATWQIVATETRELVK